MQFFNKTKWVLTKQSDPLIKPDQSFSLPVYIIDSLGLDLPTTVTGQLVKTNGRTKTVLPTIVTVTDGKNGNFTFTATPTSSDWSGADTLGLQVTCNGTDVSTLGLVTV